MKRLIYIILINIPFIIYSQSDTFNLYFSHDFQENTVGVYDYDEWFEDWNHPEDPPPYNNWGISQGNVSIVNNEGNRVMHCDYDSGVSGYGNMGFGWWAPLRINTKMEELYISFNMKFDENYDSRLSGKIPIGFGSDNPASAGVWPEPEDGFWWIWSWTGTSERLYDTLFFYSYEHGHPYEDPWWGEVYYTNIPIDRGVWHNFTVRQVLNTFTGETPNSDGIFEAFLDSVCVASYDDILFRELEIYGIDSMMISWFYGGGSGYSFQPQWDGYVEMDNYVVWSYKPAIEGIVYGNNTYNLEDKILIPPMSTPMDSSNYIIYESHTTGEDTWEDVVDGVSDVEAQAFTMQDTAILDYFRFKGFRLNSPGTLYVNLFYADADSLPILTDTLATGTYNGDALTYSTDGEWFIVYMSVDTLLEDSTYSVSIMCDGENNVNEFLWLLDTDNGYIGGCRSNSYGGWQNYADHDFLFEVNGHAITAEQEEAEENNDTLDCTEYGDLIQYNTETINDFWSAIGEKWESQLIVIQNNFEISCLSVQIKKIGEPDTLECLIFEVSDSIPVGDSISYGVRDLEWLLAYEEDTINFSMSEYSFNAGDSIAVIWRCKDGDEYNHVQILSATPGTYEHGDRLTTLDSGVAWEYREDEDFWFVLYGELDTQNPLYLKKNASVVQFKKNGYNVNFKR